MPGGGSDATAAAAGQAAWEQLIPWQVTIQGLLYNAVNLQCELELARWQQLVLQRDMVAPLETRLSGSRGG